MTVRMTQTGSGPPAGSVGSVAGSGTRSRAVPGPAGQVPAPLDPTRREPLRTAATGPSEPLPAGRRAQRAARRHRRNLAVGCVALVAFCLAVTVLIVVLAGNRTPAPPVGPASGIVAAPQAIPTVGAASAVPGRGRG